jgi:hypothetical protein
MWQIDESSIKAHIEPAAETIANSLSIQYIRPVTKDPNDVVRYDTSEMRMRPNRSKEAIELYDRGELKSETLLRETGFTHEDSPDEEERRRWNLARIVANSSATPEMMAEALRLLGVDVGSGVGEEVVNENRPDPSLQDHPVRELPPIPDAAALDVGLAASCDAMVFRALERAGNRIRSRKNFRPVGVDAADIYLHTTTKPTDLDALLDDAWSCAPRLLRGLPFEQKEAVQGALDEYARHLLTAQVEHDPTLMIRYLTHSSVRNPVV